MRRGAAGARPHTPLGRLVRAVLVLAVVGAASAACSPRPADDTPGVRTSSAAPAKAGTGELRHDLDPLTSRIPALTQVRDATWSSGTLGGTDVPGPSLYWIDAVVTLPGDVADGLRASLELEPAASAPEVVDALEPSLPPGELLAGPALDDAFSAAGDWRSTAYLEADGDRVVLVVVGE